MVENQELLDVCTCRNCALHALFLGWLRVKICQLLAKTASDEIKQVKRSKTKGVTPTLNGYSNLAYNWHNVCPLRVRSNGPAIMLQCVFPGFVAPTVPSAVAV